ncbi:hypothetical protein [Brevibacillus brevis]|uniref:hypothetical protein n=1 Tax=Brevibacillus brevis TaxID=1393 RepID=UPI000D107F42|nr:hypothetical protein [Brevibacillus brevis]PSJ66618.1 hypothetical protein C7J99_24845 [Brevibacillus brevis]RED20914.1 hypothetical protein DES34_12814 [Brevibacillus brevis]VEF86625.1 Uncharacterised protein [Brevibacillus brevis]
MKKQTEELLTDFVDTNQKYRKVIHAIIAQWVKDFQSGKIIVNSVCDLHSLMKMEQELQKTIATDTKQIKDKQGRSPGGEHQMTMYDTNG